MKYGWGAIVGAVGIFGYAVCTRLLALSQPYHQDEYKWALAAEPRWGQEGSIPHPELARLTYEYVGGVIGYQHLRIVPAVLSLIVLALIFVLVRREFGKREAFAAAGVFSLTFFALLGSVQIDIDGVFLPLFTLLTFLGYSVWRSADTPRAARRGVLVTALGLVGGFGAKLSFVLSPAAVVADMVWRSPAFVRSIVRRAVIVPAAVALAFLGGLAILFWNDVWFLRYVDNFIAFGGRDLGQIVFQTVKGVIYLSPLAVFGLVLGLRHVRELSLWYIFLVLNILFYFVVFDFSHRTFDRYLLFFVVPASVIAGVALARLFDEVAIRRRVFAVTAALTLLGGGLLIHTLFSLPHRSIPLIPKAAFVDAVLSGQWSFLLPITGGSGPLGFYVPFDAIALLWICAGLAALVLLFRRTVSSAALAIFVGISLVYNACMTLEYLTGHYFGSAPRVLAALIEDIDASGDTSKLLTYNDIGAHELYFRGIYAARFYPHDAYIPDNVEKFSRHDGRFLVVEMPEINDASGYGRYFAACTRIFERSDKKITGAVLDCAGVPVDLIGSK